jgi:hypothetical protein
MFLREYRNGHIAGQHLPESGVGGLFGKYECRTIRTRWMSRGMGAEVDQPECLLAARNSG